MFARENGAHVDIFVETFEMCHALELKSRLEIHNQTISLADLLLTKLQVAELNHKDVTDTAALLHDHEITTDESGINGRYVGEILGRDWGWWRTVTENLEALPTHLTDVLPPADIAVVGERSKVLRDQIEAAPRNLRWKARARAGDRIPWRNQPEDSH
jgi:hypothetical protein